MMSTNLAKPEHHGAKPSSGNAGFDIHEAIHLLKHYLPAQAPLKDFIHHNTLHAFQDLEFHHGIRKAADMFGYKVLMQIDEYRQAFKLGKIREAILEEVLARHLPENERADWKTKLLRQDFPTPEKPLVGRLRDVWRTACHIDMDTLVHPMFFRILCSYLDQGIAIWNFPATESTFLGSIQALERNSFASFFRTQRARKLLLEGCCTVQDLLQILVGNDQRYYLQYLFDLAFAHQGWSGLVAQVEDHPETMLEHKPIRLEEIIVLELLLEIDALDNAFGGKWDPIGAHARNQHIDLFADRPCSDFKKALMLWHEAFEWSYYDEVLGTLKLSQPQSTPPPCSGEPRFQAMFCIDDRECSLRRYIEQEAPGCETYGTAGFFGVEFYFQPEGGKFYTKLCPAPVTPKHLIKEFGASSKRKIDPHLSKRSHSLGQGWLISQTLGFWSALQLLFNLARPSMAPAMTNAFDHHDRVSNLTVENTDPNHIEKGLQVGFGMQEMAQRVEALLRSIGLTGNFAPIVYVIGHGSSSINNPHYAAYDCGACSGRPGSVNARVICQMANHSGVRELLAERGICIPPLTRFVGGLHDTCRDEIEFYDEEALSIAHLQRHEQNVRAFANALDSNAKERSRRLALVDSSRNASKVHQRIKLRSVSLFEPRPELNHASNAICIVGRRPLTQHLFLDRRAFLNSYNCQSDPEGKFLLGILKAVAPVCGGINLEYFFSRVDNQKCGAGSKLPHNVMGLFGVANGADGDLRPGLPRQMIEIHDPVRLLVIVEHDPAIVLQTIQQHAETYQWFINEWVHLAAFDPRDQQLHAFKEGRFLPYLPLHSGIHKTGNMEPLIEKESGNLPIYQINS